MVAVLKDCHFFCRYWDKGGLEMSIFPKKLIKGKDNFTTFHMKIYNNSDEVINGQIKYKVIMPNGKIDEFNLNRIEQIEGKSELNEYDNYYINATSPIGRYYVEGSFCWNGMNVLSETNENDFFDVIEGV